MCEELGLGKVRAVNLLPVEDIFTQSEDQENKQPWHPPQSDPPQSDTNSESYFLCEELILDEMYGDEELKILKMKEIKNQLRRRIKNKRKQNKRKEIKNLFETNVIDDNSYDVDSDHEPEEDFSDDTYICYSFSKHAPNYNRSWNVKSLQTEALELEKAKMMMKVLEAEQENTPLNNQEINDTPIDDSKDFNEDRTEVADLYNLLCTFIEEVNESVKKCQHLKDKSIKESQIELKEEENSHESSPDDNSQDSSLSNTSDEEEKIEREKDVELVRTASALLQKCCPNSDLQIPNFEEKIVNRKPPQFLSSSAIYRQTSPYFRPKSCRYSLVPHTGTPLRHSPIYDRKFSAEVFEVVMDEMEFSEETKKEMQQLPDEAKGMIIEQWKMQKGKYKPGTIIDLDPKNIVTRKTFPVIDQSITPVLTSPTTTPPPQRKKRKNSGSLLTRFTKKSPD